ncbi:MAG: hypothetical protein ACE3K2_00505 [Paenibacillus sp.]|uniref:hypothetical protein n=1 Tax=Paenibacillus TaxID=44249 RepID=UPI003B7B43B4
MSSCLAGVACRYNGTASQDEKIQELVEKLSPQHCCDKKDIPSFPKMNGWSNYKLHV